MKQVVVLIVLIATLSSKCHCWWYRAPSDNKCAVGINYARAESFMKPGQKYFEAPDYEWSGIKMNFKSSRENNWNTEKFDSDSGAYEKTTERVDGGMLNYVSIHAFGKSCVQRITLSCGSRLNSRGTERSVILDVPTIREAWFHNGNPRFLEIDWSKDCIWFSDEDYRSLRNMEIHVNAFTDCSNDDKSCLKRFIRFFD